MQEANARNMFNFLGNDQFIKIANAFAIGFLGCELTAIVVIIDMAITKIYHP